MGGVAHRKKHVPPHMCHLAKRDRCALKDVNHKIGELLLLLLLLLLQKY